MSKKKTVLLLTDFSYQAKGREYFKEDVELSCYLRKHFNVYTSHIEDSEKIINDVDAVLIRNTGPQELHKELLTTLRNRKDLALFNDLLGKGDINGKHHLLTLFKARYPVIPTFDSKNALTNFGIFEKYLLKPINGADSHGVKIFYHEELNNQNDINCLFQPFVQFEHEISFYFIGKQYEYSLFAENPSKRWDLQPYIATQEDILFASQFVNWNTCRFGIQRVDTCRLKDGTLMLMELEDYNPYLSLDRLPNNIKYNFLERLCCSINETINQRGNLT